ncbi:hypothetical protein, unknown function [Leishmania tarentolae]|uniref:GOLD domain-containing protein n=1 Tax=Leishmania tarentolae TaxID=5689 RepID=A0A640KS71_LEITA|nr:hypothetical protein, unknown function [Leishmania tarentolae]
MRLTNTQRLVLLASLLWVVAGVHAAISFNLNSIDYPVYDVKKSMKEYAVLPSNGNACFLLSLNKGLGGVVRFAYSSNVSNVQWRSDVLLTIHKPSDSDPSIAILDKVDAVVEAKLYRAKELEELNRAGGVTRRGPKAQGTANTGAGAAQLDRGTAVNVRPAQGGTGPAAKFISGNYAVCFHLIRSRAAAQKPLSDPYEEVRIQLIEVASTRHSTSMYIARLNDAAANSPNGNEATRSPTEEVDREHAKMIRSIFRASSTADLRTLLDEEVPVTSNEVRSRLEELKALQKQLFVLYDNFEHLEDRFRRMRVTSETTFSRIWVCMLITVVVMGGTVWSIFHYTKGIIIKRKLI